MGTFVIFGSAWLARRLELAEALATAACTQALTRIRPATKGEILEIGGGYVVFAGPVSPMTQAIGVGMGTPVTAQDIDRIEAFYRERDANANIHLCPLADSSLSEILGSRCYRPVEFTNMLVRLAPANGPEHAPPPGVDVRIIDSSEMDLWATTVLRGFLERDELTEPELELGAMTSADPETIRLLATFEGRPAGAACFVVRDGVALFSGDSTLKEFRARGIQLSLLRARLRMAAERGAELLAASTLPGSISQRNYERCGFQVVYTKAAMLKEFSR